MTANIDIFSWRSLTESLNKVLPPPTFISDTIFKTTVNHAADIVDIDIWRGKTKLARFVNKGESPALIGKDSSVQKQSVTLPRIFEKKIFTANELANFKTDGMVYAGSPADIVNQSNLYKMRELQSLQDRLARRKEMMACTLLTTGALSVDQSNIEFTYDYKYGAGVSLVTLTGSEKWDQTTPKIISQIRKQKTNMIKRTGAAPTVGILGTDAADKFLEDAGVMKGLNNLNYKVGQLDLNGNVSNGADYLGRFLGIDWYVYGGSYTDDNDAEQELYGTKLCTLVAPDNSFRMHYGPIYRIEGGQTLTIRNNTYLAPFVNDYGTDLEWLIESKPLPVVHNPDRVIAITTY